ncbi:hypothetical protein [Natronospira bacteriovora]|uniref:Uncharacterized protein n=1 Tax=Natronospira bacteriovora TaxID=3069753 RepID=A0ABU0W5K0_9GAMM|nr:hypothetical protein [Natronospira sp. AB-CW4]MDQ2069289.1 hypothetical protein [Natronospira sp. AB-CW4]
MLGRDCDGKPLYPGDVVMFLPDDPENPMHKHAVGLEGTVECVCPHSQMSPDFKPGIWVIVHFSDRQNRSAALDRALKKIRSGKQPTTTWEEIKKTTGGWTPTVTDNEKEAA